METLELSEPSGHGGLWQPFRQSQQFRWLWLGQSLSSFGDNILFVVVPMVVYSLTQSTIAMGLFMTLLTVPQVILLPFTGLMVDRWPRVRLMILTDAARFVLLLLLLLLNLTLGLNMEMLDAFAIVYGAMDALFQPAYSAARQQVFTPDIRNSANSLTQTAQTAARLLGPSLGGFLLTFGSISWGLGIDALTFVVSIVSLLFLHLPPPRDNSSYTSGFYGWVQQLLGGYHALRKHAWLWITILVFALINIAFGGIVLILLPWLVKVHLGLPAVSYGLITSGEGVGSIMAAWLFGRKSRWRHRGLMGYLGTAFSAAGLAGLALVHSLPLLIFLSAVSGAGIMVFGLIWEGSLQELVPTESFGRVVSLDMFGSVSLLPLGYIFTGWLSGIIGGINTIFYFGIGMLVLTLSVLLIPSIRHFD